MKTEIDLFTIRPEDKIPGTGKVLVSEPFLPDSFFNRTVVILTEHTEKGSVGFILNKMVQIKVSDAVEGFGSFNERLTMGGPVSPDTLHYLHTLGDLVPGSIHVTGDLFWGGEIDAIRQLVKDKRAGYGDIRFFLGYSGWGEGQLERELSEDSWLIGEAATELIMRYHEPDIWKKVLRTMKQRYRIWADFPESPEMN
jgi:putative transcriptional regulator